MFFVQKDWGECKLYHTQVWFGRFAVFRKAWFLPLEYIYILCIHTGNNIASAEKNILYVEYFIRKSNKSTKKNYPAWLLKRQWNFAHMLCVSTPRRDLWGWFPFFFRRIFWFLVEGGPNFPNNLITDQRPCKKETLRPGLRKGAYKTFATFHSLIL